MNAPPTVSPQEWAAARDALLVQEKELTRARDALAARRRRMPRMAVEQEYAFDGPDGPASLKDCSRAPAAHVTDVLFEPVSTVANMVPRVLLRGDRWIWLSQRPRYHARARAPQDIAPSRRGWLTSRYTLTDDPTRTSADGGTDQRFLREGDEILRTYLIDKRGDEAMGSTWSYLDITPLGRQELWEDSPEGYPQTQAYVWWNRHDEYDEAPVWEAALSDAAASQRGAAST